MLSFCEDFARSLSCLEFFRSCTCYVHITQKFRHSKDLYQSQSVGAYHTKELEKMPDNILSLKDKFDVFLLDIYGVIWDGKKPIDGAKEAMSALRRSGKKVILLSNDARLSTDIEAEQVKRGFIKGVHYDKLVTSGDLAHEIFTEDNRKLKYYNFCEPGSLFKKTCYVEVKNPEQADFVYLGTPRIFKNGQWQDCLTISPFEAELKRFYELDLPVICVNGDMKAHSGQYDEAVIRSGSAARYYEDLGGEVEYFGKPYPQIFDFALQDIETPDDRILMVGDTLETDILGGNTYGIKTALTLTGIAKDNMEEEEFATIEEYCAEVQIQPDYILKLV